MLIAAVTLLLLASVGEARAQSNYPLEATIVITDENGNVVSGSTEVSVLQSLRVAANGWGPNSEVTLSFFCGSGDSVALGTFRADASGVVRETFLVPDAGSGSCTLRVSGAGVNGNERQPEGSMMVRGAVLAASDDAASVNRASDNRTLGGDRSRALAFGKTGSELWPLAQVGFGLFAVGAALFLAVRRNRVDSAHRA